MPNRRPQLEIVAISADRSDGIAELRTRLEHWLSNAGEESLSENVAQTAEVVAAE